MTDHEIHLALAEFMGWAECPAEACLIPRGHFAVTHDPGCDPTVWRSLAPRSTHEPWVPTANPAQAIEVAAEAARRGWIVSMRLSPAGASVLLNASDLLSASTEADTLARAICSATARVLRHPLNPAAVLSDLRALASLPDDGAPMRFSPRDARVILKLIEPGETTT